MSGKNRDTINEMKRVFDKYDVERLNLEDAFYNELIGVIKNSNNVQYDYKDIQKPIQDKKDIKDAKMEHMINIEGLLNQVKSNSKGSRLTFGLDIPKISLGIFLKESNLFLRQRDFKRSDIIVFYDDTMAKLGNRGFAVTRDEIITNMGGMFKVLRFMDMKQEVEYVKGHKKDAFRIHMDDTSVDVKFNSNVKYKQELHDILKLLYKYGELYKEELKKNVSRMY